MRHVSSTLLCTLSYTLLPVLALFLAFSFTKPFVVEATQVPTFLGYVGQTPSLTDGDIFFNFSGTDSVAVDSQDSVYIGEWAHVSKINQSGNLICSFGEEGSGDGQFNGPILGMVVDDFDNVYVLDSRNGRVQKFDSNCSYISKFGGLGSGDGQLANPYGPTGPDGIAIDSSGNIYISDTYNHRIQKFDSSGNFLGTRLASL